MDLNSDGKTIGTIIITIIFLIGLIIIIDEIYNLTKFAYRYTYLYNYGNMNEKVCDKNKLEYETARFRIYNEINKYKLEKDVFNKTWLNYLVYIGIFILSVLISISFGYLFYQIFINNNPNCNATPTDENKSILKQILECLCVDCHTYIPNCLMNYIMLFVLIIVYPLIYILKSAIKLDFTWNSGYYIKLLHILFFIGLVYYLIVIFIQKSEDTNEDRYNKALIYTFFIIIFYMNNYIFNKNFDEFNNITKVYNLYNYKNESQKEADTTFFDIYKQEEPLKPDKIEIPDELKDYKEYNIDEYTKLSEQEKLEYTKTTKIIKDYYKNLKNYDNDLQIYKDKYNVYKNNRKEFPDVIYILYTMLPELTGINNKEIQILFIILVLLIIFIYYLKSNNNKYGDYVFYTAFIYILGILSITIITLAVLNYNTYLNKYLIYEPINNYKNSINNKNTIFNLIIKNDKLLKEFYKRTSAKLNSNISIGIDNSSTADITDLIKKIKDKNEINNLVPTIPSSDIDKSSILGFQLKFYKTIYSYTLITLNNTYNSQITDANNYNKYNYYYNDDKKYFSTQKQNSLNINDYDKLKEYIKLLLVNDENAIKERIKQLKINLKFYVYNYEKTTNFNNIKLDKSLIIKKKEIKEIPVDKNEGELYNQNLNLIDKAFDIYEEFLIDCRNIFIELFNNLKISCSYTNYINVNEKIVELDNVLLNKDKNEFKDNKNEPAIDIYKKIIENIIAKLDKSLKKHINIIKIYVRLFELIETGGGINKREIIQKIINNYNLFANDEDKHTSNDFYKFYIKLKSNFVSNKYNSFDSLDLKKMNISTNNVSWSFIILIIIFAIILLEPLII
jgi:hypothetical protein